MDRDQATSASAPANQKAPANSNQQDDGRDDADRKRNNIRKRTKTGCLTCRKRRIKCDEGRPICNNCIKSKRQCEGYNQRVIFKHPMGAIQGGPYGPAYYPHGSAHLVGNLQPKPPSQGLLPTIAPKPPSFDYNGHQPAPYGHYAHGQGAAQTSPNPYDFNSSAAAHPYGQANGMMAPDPPMAYNRAQQDPRDQYGMLPGQYGPPYAIDGQADPLAAKKGSVDMGRTESDPSIDYEDIDIPEDDASMGESDDDTQDPRQVLGPVMKQFNGTWDTNGTRVRTFSTFAQCNILSDYTATARITELKDPAMLQIFMHFIQVTGPSMSLYERHPFDHTGENSFDPTPKGANNLWSYTFPVISLNHPALLHSMLALGALQIAKLQNIPATAAMKHYHLAIRRIARNVNTPLRRTQPATIAATLLLSYFEVWSSDHTKWCNHLLGARILFSEIPLRNMSKKFLPVKRFKQAEKDAQNQNQMDSFFPGLSIPSQSELNDHDYDLLQAISGQNITAEDYGLGENQGIDLSDSVTDRDIEHYENVRDLFWWYCKMDVYQSMLAGTRLFMNYESWSQCPPRAPISKLEAIYGSYDHLMLLLGRLADFSSKDIARKKRASQARGPPPGAPGSSPPPFNGIVPTDGNFQVPRGFTPPKESSPQSDSSEDTDLDESYRVALDEWESIKRGFEAYESKLGPEFQPLKPEFSDKRDSPFGMTMQYRTFSVAGIWMNFYMGMINLVRCHPSMPPAAMQAAGMAAPQTGPYSNKLGRIAAGLSEDVSQATEITTLVSAAFIESCFCLFVAAIEYRDEKQRHWVIRHLRDITRLTGWQSAERIATGCESSWMKAAQLGRGPPYIRAPETEPVPVARWQAPRQIDRFIQEVETGEIRRQIHVPKAERAQFALGLLSVERDFEALDLKDDD
ncbi:hypothetical protein SNK03_012222 [Fusarium graminearum]|uniref:Chromosome 3, complete genome n=1 Tax=Gibberella zeae (strain ATCC MYA-4620 / CBS 123657 / FGSC 9075 / NRRL 31084 / PH-1) TaxID=229533 RepID=A0A1C3YK28_GIBZE|nr:hypothetical protein FGRA07_06052 [Fusarium graminearum]SCB64879.1 unnamed protein product [Fusarium graminearum]